VADAASTIAIEILKAARRWVQHRVVLRRILDSKRATPQQLEKAKKDHHLASDELEALVMKLEKHLHSTGKIVSTKRGSPFPWREFAGMVAAGAKAVENALETNNIPSVIKGQVIDMPKDK
jgi:hypothetical protein